MPSTVAQERQEEAGHRLEALEQTRTDRARVAGALEGRIAEVVAESEALAAQEEQLTAIIAEAEEQARRDVAERSRREAEQVERARRAAAEQAAQAEAERRARTRRASPGRDSPPAPSPSSAPSPSGAGLVWPLRGPVTSEYGPRWGRLHAGLDIARETGAAIVAAGSGRVIYSGSMSGYGNVVMIDHGGRLTTVYAHQSRIAVREGASVDRGEVIGYVGSTGRSTGPHLHFETRVGGSPRKPAQLPALTDHLP